jgi:hypothetical protein
VSDKLEKAIKRIKSGDKAGGKQLLVEILEVEPANEQAWLWMSAWLGTTWAARGPAFSVHKRLAAITCLFCG